MCSKYVAALFSWDSASSLFVSAVGEDVEDSGRKGKAKGSGIDWPWLSWQGPSESAKAQVKAGDVFGL